jgi:hypothetical protein
LPTWTRPLIAGATELRILPGSRTAGDADWRPFVERHHKPDLRGRRVAVLGGNRALLKAVVDHFRTLLGA